MSPPRRPGPVLRGLLRAPVWLYRCGLGWTLGHRFLLLTHTGRRSGRRYQTVVEVVAFDRHAGEAVVMSGFGATADWYRNIRHASPAEVRIGRRRFQPTVRFLEAEEAVSVMADYEYRNRWAAPVVRRVLSLLVGWPYDGSAEARRRLVDELPLVAFRPGLTVEPTP